jgi:hypothetical protein
LFSIANAANMPFQSDSTRKRAMAVAALKQRPAPAPASAPKMFHATMLVTRAEEWCVEAESAQEAHELLAAGQGHRCHIGDRVQFEVERVEE